MVTAGTYILIGSLWITLALCIWGSFYAVRLISKLIAVEKEGIVVLRLWGILKFLYIHYVVLFGHEKLLTGKEPGDDAKKLLSEIKSCRKMIVCAIVLIVCQTVLAFLLAGCCH